MLILCQDKKSITNLRNVDLIGVESEGKDYCVVLHLCSDNEYICGRYETEERAKEVLGEILERYTYSNCGYPGYVMNVIYHMPKE